MSLAGPPPVSTNPVLRLVGDLRAERNVPVPFPPGDMTPSLRRTRGFAEDPLHMLLDAYERHGPVFTQRVFHGNVVFMIGPEANHFMTVSHADHFTWREGHMGDMMPLLGDGLLTIDGDFHRRSRRIMLPGFHRERVARRAAGRHQIARLTAVRRRSRARARASRARARRRVRVSTRAPWARCSARCARGIAATSPVISPRGPGGGGRGAGGPPGGVARARSSRAHRSRPPAYGPRAPP